MKNILFLILSTLIFSCGKTTDNTKTAEDSVKPIQHTVKPILKDGTIASVSEAIKVIEDTTSLKYKYIKLFIKKFQILSFPVSIRSTLKISSTKLYSDKSNEVNRKSYDTLFVEDIGYNTCDLCYGILPDTSRFYSLILFFHADDLVPILMTFTKDGKKISETSLIVNGCGSDCGLDYCSSTGLIEKDLSIYCADSINYAPCNENNEKDESKREHYINYKQGRINPDGTIQLSEGKRKDLLK